MENKNEKTGFFARLTDNKKAKKSSCCCQFEVEEIPDEVKENESDKLNSKDKGNSCC